MKKLFILLIFVLPPTLIFSQFYIHPYIGYSRSLHPEKVQTGVTINMVKNIYVDKIKYGKGCNLGIDIGYKFKEHWLIGLTTNTQFFTKSHFSHEQIDYNKLEESGINSFSYWGYLGDYQYKFQNLQFSPQFGYYEDFHKFSLYLRFGPNFLKSKASVTREYIEWEMDGWWEYYPLHVKEEMEYTGKLKIGLQSSLGIDYHLTDKLNLTAEFLLINTNYTWNKAERIRYEIDGVNHLNDFEKKTYDLDKSAGTVDFSQIGINIGIRYFIGNNKRELVQPENLSQ
jgi:hypothetical protein